MNNFERILLSFTFYIFLSFCTNAAFGQCGKARDVPQEFVKNRLSGDGDYYGHPYTIFNKQYSDFNIDNEVFSITDEILKEWKTYVKAPSKGKGPILAAYKAVFDFAEDDRPDDVKSDETSDYSKLAVWAKCNAFVLLVGVNDTGAAINREIYLNRVYQAFEHMNIEGVVVRNKTMLIQR